MSHQERLVICIGLIASLLFSTISVVAQTSTSDWNALHSLAVDSKISVKLKIGKTVEGRFKNVSDSSLTLTARNNVVDVKREDVDSVYEVKRKSATKSTLIGLGIGAGGGAAIGAAGASNDDNFDKLDHAVIAGLAVVGAVGGTVTGYLLGRRSKRVVIYQSK